MSSPATPPTVLVTGFEPFGQSTQNPSQLVAQSIADMRGTSDPAITLHTAMLPVDTRRIGQYIQDLWHNLTPDIVLHFGESARAQHLTLERVALNLLDFDRPDNAGQQVVDQPIEPKGPPARFATLPVRALQQRLHAHGIQSVLSLSAGAYLCNQALYLSLGWSQKRPSCTVGFVHVPALHEQVAAGERTGPTMPRHVLLDAAAAVVHETVVLHNEAAMAPRH